MSSSIPLYSALHYSYNTQKIEMLRRKNNRPALASLKSLRRSVAWAQQESLFTGRDNALLVLELLRDEDQQRNYLTLSLRGLYQHVLDAITTLPTESRTTTTTSSGRQSRRQQDQENNVSLPRPDKNNSNNNDSLTTTEALPESDTVGIPARDEETGHGRDLQQQPPTSRVVAPASGSSSSSRPHRSMHKRASVRTLHVKQQSSSSSSPEEEVTYRERLGGYLHPRDMRKLVTPFSATNEPELIVRRHVMLLNFDPLRAIVLRDRLLVLVPNGADSMLSHLETRVRGGGLDEVEASVFDRTSVKQPESGAKRSLLPQKAAQTVVKKAAQMFKKRGSSDLPARTSTVSDESSTNETTTAGSQAAPHGHYDMMESEWNEMTRHEWVNLPFELQCADAVLHVVSNLLAVDTAELQKAIDENIHRLLQSSDHHLSGDPLTVIRAIKDGLSEMSSRVKSFLQSLNRILDDDRHMALMNLSRLLTHPDRYVQPVSQEVLDEESDEPELILEAHLQTALTLTNAIHLMQGQIDSAAALVDQKLDAVRNRLLYANMVISILSLCVGSASLVGSIFGMNLTNFLEDDPNAFRQITFGTVSGAFAMALTIMFYLTYSGTIHIGGGEDASR